jgi:FeS assembly SUF system regulator
VLRLTKLTDYAIVLLTHFAADPPDGAESEVWTARGLAAASLLPLPTVSKVLKQLSRAGILISHRGVAGGYSLARPAEAISVADVIAAIEGPISLTECSAVAPSLCELEPSCPSRSNWRRINEAVRGALERLSVAEMSVPAALPRPHPEGLVTLSVRK